MTRWDGLFIGAAAMSLGHSQDVRGAVGAGLYDARQCRRDAYRAVCVADDGALPGLVVRAADLARRRSGVPAGEVDLVLHASSWAVRADGCRAEGVRRALRCPRATALEVRDRAGSGLVGLHLAAQYLSASPDMTAALVTTGDASAAPGGDRFRRGPGRVLADGATAVVVRTGTGLVRVLATTVVGESPHRLILRSDLPWRIPDAEPAPEPDAVAGPEAEQARLAELLADREREVMADALADAGLGVDDIARFVFPHLGSGLQRWDRRAALGIDEKRTTWDWGNGIGHLPSGDQAAGLAHLLGSAALGAGDKVVLVGDGFGGSLGCAVLEVL
ncbi:ketoacyl-ACP synthase III family protein [Streptomyces muensis]|uniref:Ketoacyl-ACP synthase III family protein n=1 Tax=Streptomyces muensis TaxID=1077944 RepID=A0A9X1Q1S3_STRM4|nr:ketoacyl-ACP synthase III family protein [Streptomyces muensis]MCF1597397.1 ketoacyl-ACP synthase III family protein [Streptomyces muensis]